MYVDELRGPLIVGVDGGGTKTDVMLATIDDCGEIVVLGEGQSGPSNMRLAGRKQTLKSLEEAVGQAAAPLVKHAKKADIAVLALAGSDFSDVQHELKQWANENGLFKRIEIVNDADAVLAAGSDRRWGVALVVGTGSIAIGVDRKGRFITRGGWGHWYGDKGSGYDLAARALAAVSEAEDGMGPETTLTVRMLEHFQLENPRLIIQKLYATGNVRAHIAKAAPVVLEAAAGGDIVAVRIVEACAGELCRLVTAVTCDLEFSDAYPLALSGGVICNSESYRARLEAGLRSINPAPGLIRAVPKPVMGAIRIGQKILNS